MPLSELTTNWVKERLPKRPADANKGTFGKVLVIAGSEKYPGAAYLCCSASYRVGVGLVTLATTSLVQNIVSKQLPEVTFIILPQKDGVISGLALDSLYKEIGGYDVILIGPGLGNKDQTKKFVHELFRLGVGDLNFVIDGDGLNILSQTGEWDRLLENRNSAILTPHPGEMGRLTGLTVKQIQSNREKIAKKYAGEWGQIVVLKGANTLVVSPAGELKISPFANPALAVAGTGDILSGMIAGFLAQGLNLFDAACCGVYIHGLAGYLLSKEIGPGGALASDLLPLIPKVLRKLRQT